MFGKSSRPHDYIILILIQVSQALTRCLVIKHCWIDASQIPSLFKLLDVGNMPWLGMVENLLY